jgi:phage replication-related protein YjqB (UPF0714/DUF867 family)
VTVFGELLACPGVVERAELRSPVGFMAIHGGSLERGTAEIAAAAARACGASLYTIEQPPDLRWHLPSHLTDREASDALAAFCDHVEVVVSVHGYGREGWWTRVLLGGADRAVSTELAACLRKALPAYEIVDQLDVIPIALRGLHPTNPANVAPGGGVQLELPPRIRGIGPRASAADTAALVAALGRFGARTARRP